MSAYNYPSQGGLKLTTAGRTFGIWCDVTPVGHMLILAEQVNGEWLARWYKGPTLEQDLQAEINGMGSIVNWLKSLVGQICTALAQLFGTVTTQPKSLAEQINAALQQSFTLTVGSNGVPVLAPK